MNIFLLILIAALLLAMPFATVWSLNTLFLLGIPYTGETWLAVLLLTAVFGGSQYRNK